MIRKTLGIAVLVALALAMPATAHAQTSESVAREISRGRGFTIENSTECSPNTDVVISYGAAGAEPRRIAASVSDADGHFSTNVALPVSAELGQGTVIVDCGIDGGVLRYDVVVIEPLDNELLQYAPHAAGAVGALLFLVLLVSRARKRSRSPKAPTEVNPSAIPPLPSAAPLEADDEDGADYWFWDNTTERGPVKRLACLTDDEFYLHEVPAEAFNPLLELLATAGPDVALQGAFFRVAVTDIDEIRYRGTEMQVTYLLEGEFTTQTIDLATEVDGVIGLLSRRVPITEAAHQIQAP